MKTSEGDNFSNAWVPLSYATSGITLRVEAHLSIFPIVESALCPSCESVGCVPTPIHVAYHQRSREPPGEASEENLFFFEVGNEPVLLRF